LCVSPHLSPILQSTSGAYNRLAPWPGFSVIPYTQISRQAGRTETVLADTAAACFTEQERPTTPDEMRRFRKSFTGAPGKRIQHWGSENDPPPRAGEFPFGVKNEKGHGVGDMLGGHLEPTPMDAFKLMKAEECYSSAKVCFRQSLDTPALQPKHIVKKAPGNRTRSCTGRQAPAG
jgi:hypothetical protein